MSEPGDLSQAIVEEGGTEQERTTPENGIVKAESLDEEEKLELQVSLGKTDSQAIVYSSCFSFLDCFESLLSSFLQKSLTRRMTRKSIKLSSPSPIIGHSFFSDYIVLEMAL